MRKPDKPNVLLICTDHWFGDMIGALGHPTALTPTLDHLIGNGVALLAEHPEQERAARLDGH